MEYELSIDREFRDLCPDLSPEEYKALEESILKDGCREPITLWAGHDSTILDGHNRYRICKKHERTFKTRALNLTRDEALAWIITNQLGRRNLDPSQRAMLAAKMPTVGRGPKVEGAAVPLSKVSEIAEQFDVSERSVKSARKIVADGIPALRKAVESGEIPVAVGAVAANMTEAAQKRLVARGPDAVRAAVKKYKDTFDPAEFEKKATNGKPKEFNDGMVEKLYGQLIRVLDDKVHVSGSGGGNGAECRASLKASYKSFLTWSGKKK